MKMVEQRLRRRDFDHSLISSRLWLYHRQHSRGINRSPQLSWHKSSKPQGVIVLRRLRADWRQEWEDELNYRELPMAG